MRLTRSRICPGVELSVASVISAWRARLIVTAASTPCPLTSPTLTKSRPSGSRIASYNVAADLCLLLGGHVDGMHLDRRNVGQRALQERLLELIRDPLLVLIEEPLTVGVAAQAIRGLRQPTHGEDQDERADDPEQHDLPQCRLQREVGRGRSAQQRRDDRRVLFAEAVISCLPRNWSAAASLRRGAAISGAAISRSQRSLMSASALAATTAAGGTLPSSNCSARNCSSMLVAKSRCAMRYG